MFIDGDSVCLDEDRPLRPKNVLVRVNSARGREPEVPSFHVGNQYRQKRLSLRSNSEEMVLVEADPKSRREPSLSKPW